MFQRGRLISKLVTVTGASGHLGANIVRSLLARGYKVRAVVRSDTRALKDLPCEVVKADILNINQLITAFKDSFAVIHSAAHISITSFDEEKVWKINVEGTKNVIEAAKACNVKKLIYIGSIHAFKDNGNTVDENSPLVDERGSIYDLSKAQATRVVQEAMKNGLNAVILSPTALIGPYDYKPSFIGRFLISLAKGRVPALVTGGFDWVDVRDVAEAVLSAIENGKGTYILSGEYLKVKDLAELWCKIVGVKRPNLIVPLEIAQFGAKIALTLSGIFKFSLLFTPEALNALTWKSSILRRKAEEELNYKPRSIETTLNDTYKWFREHGYL